MQLVMNQTKTPLENNHSSLIPSKEASFSTQHDSSYAINTKAPTDPEKQSLCCCTLSLPMYSIQELLSFDIDIRK